jgi:hypothetical protein
MRAKEFIHDDLHSQNRFDVSAPDQIRANKWRRLLQLVYACAANRSGPTERDLQVAWERFRSARRRANATYAFRRAMGARR